MRTVLLLASSSLALAACGLQPMMGSGSSSPPVVDNTTLPPAVRVPAGETVKLWTTTSGGRITYECRQHPDLPDQHVWVFVGPVAMLKDSSGKVVGKYYGPPATWESTDGSKVTGKQVAVAPHQAGSLPLQLVKADAATGSGAMLGVTYVQRLRTVNGLAPAEPCTAATRGAKQEVVYAADYVFYGR